MIRHDRNYDLAICSCVTGLIGSEFWIASYGQYGMRRIIGSSRKDYIWQKIHLTFWRWSFQDEFWRKKVLKLRSIIKRKGKKGKKGESGLKGFSLLGILSNWNRVMMVGSGPCVKVVAWCLPPLQRRLYFMANGVRSCKWGQVGMGCVLGEHNNMVLKVF